MSCFILWWSNKFSDHQNVFSLLSVLIEIFFTLSWFHSFIHRFPFCPIWVRIQKMKTNQSSRWCWKGKNITFVFILDSFWSVLKALLVAKFSLSLLSFINSNPSNPNMFYFFHLWFGLLYLEMQFFPMSYFSFIPHIPTTRAFFRSLSIISIPVVGFLCQLWKNWKSCIIQ